MTNETEISTAEALENALRMRDMFLTRRAQLDESIQRVDMVIDVARAKLRRECQANPTACTVSSTDGEE